MPSKTLTPSPYCTIGPFFPGELVEGCEDLTRFEEKTACGQHILLTGRILEGGRAVRDAIVEIWQADANGVLCDPIDPHFEKVDPGFFGWGRARSNAEGWYEFRTVLPGRLLVGAGVSSCSQANMVILATGLIRRLSTTVFFSDTPEVVDDPSLNCVHPGKRSRLFAMRSPQLDRNGIPAYLFDLVLRGQNETPFFLD
jgi:protocatechuate 3,4-dioxygenase alpha subunit